MELTADSVEYAGAATAPHPGSRPDERPPHRPRTAPAASHAATGRRPAPGAVAAEWTKLWSVRSHLVDAARPGCW